MLYIPFAVPFKNKKFRLSPNFTKKKTPLNAFKMITFKLEKRLGNPQLVLLSNNSKISIISHFFIGGEQNETWTNQTFLEICYLNDTAIIIVETCLMSLAYAPGGVSVTQTEKKSL